MAKPASTFKKEAPAAQPVTPAAQPAAEPEKKDALTLVKPETALAKSQVDIGADAEEFHDTYDRNSIQIPFLQILQSNSPQVKPGEPKYIEGAKQAQFFNTVTGQTYDKVEAIPCYHYATFIEWRLREKGGGFVSDLGLLTGEKALRTTSKDEKGRDILPNGNQLVRTEVYFLLLVTEEGNQQVMCTFTSTQLKKARNWNSRLLGTKVELEDGRKVTAPMFFNSFTFSTVLEKNEKGSWYGYSVEDSRPTLAIGEATYLEAREYRKVVQSGVAAGNIAMNSGEGTPDSEPANTDVPF